MAFPGSNYASPGVYTSTKFQNPLGSTLESLKIPVFIGEGSEVLVQADLEVIRGSSSTSDQRRGSEDEAGRAVVSISATGVITRGAFNGVLDRFQVHHYPIVTGNGTGTPTTSRSDVSVTLNGVPVVVRSVVGSTGIVQISQAPNVDDEVKCTYFFHRKDSQVTDDLSEQVDPDPAVVRALKGLFDADSPGSVGGTETLNLHGDITDAQGNIIVENNNVLLLTVDGTVYTVVIPPRTNYKMSQIASAVTAAAAGTLQGSTFVNNFGASTLMLTADYSIVVGNGTANALLGFLAGQLDARVATFYTFNGPIVDGSGGGVTTTDPSHVVVKVSGRQVIPTAVNGAYRSITLAQAPKAGATVAVTYWFNTWQDTFDYLYHTGVTSVDRCGDIPGGSGYIQEADFVLQNDTIVWGTAFMVTEGTTTVGGNAFDGTQISGTLVDNQTFLSECSLITTASGGVAVASKTSFQVPFDPTTGNGRNTPLGQSLFQTVSNGRIDLPTNRPDVVVAYWGYDVQDALERRPVEVLKVEGSVITLAESVPVGAKVYASFYYSTLVDETYTLTSLNPGLSGVGTYTIQGLGETDVYGAFIAAGSKGASLTGVTLEFPSGSEMTPDFRFESGSGDDFTGPVEEIVTVEFANKEATPGRFTFPGYGPYEFIPSYSDHLRMLVGSVETTGTAGLALGNPSGFGTGFFASLVSDEIKYTGGSVGIVGRSYDIDSSEDVTLTVDGVDVEVHTPTGTNKDISFFADAINEGAVGHQSTADGGGVATINLDAALTYLSNVDDYYVGWRVVLGNGGAGTAGDTQTVTGYVGSTGVATVASWAAASPVLGDPYVIYNPDSRSVMKSATNFDGPVTIALGKHDKIMLAYSGNNSTILTPAEATIPALAYATPTALAAAVELTLNNAIAAMASAPHAGLDIEVTPDADGKLVFTFQRPGVDSYGFIRFINATSGAAADFAVLAGIDTGVSIGGSQAALVQGPIARAYACPSGVGATKPYDRLVLRNSLLPGMGGSMGYQSVLSQTGLTVKSVTTDAVTGISKTGLSVGDYGLAAAGAVVASASIFGRVGFSGGMDTDGEPLVTFYNGTGVVSANNVFSFEMDGAPVTVTFTGTAGGNPTPLGPVSSAASVLGQIVAAMAAVPGAPFGNAGAIAAAFLVRQEGAGVRLTSAETDTTSRITIGTGSANGALGFSSRAVALRVMVPAKVAAAALMGHRNTGSFSGWMFDTAAGTLFGVVALATTVFDGAGQEYLYAQDAPTNPADLGASSTIAVQDTFQGIANALRFNTGLEATSGDGGVGEAAFGGFFVISSDLTTGSGTINTSILNNGVGQDGIVGQTYRDAVTGLTFTLLPRGWSSNHNGPWVAYPDGAAAIFRINVSKTFVCDGNIPHNACPGIELKVANTSGVVSGDTAEVQTFKRGGNEPSIGDIYYVSYFYQKNDFTTGFYTKMKTIEQVYGPATSDNPVSLASYLAILNGAVLVGIKQVEKAEASEQASIETYRDAIAELEGVLPGQAKPDVIVPLRGDSLSLYQILARSCGIQSSIRYRNERTAIAGVASGTTPETVGSWAQGIMNTRFRLVYPDQAVITFSNQDGSSREEIVDGTYIAAALAGSVVSPNTDVATPWTGRRLVGFTQLGRALDAVQQNQTAVKGVTILEDKPPYLRVRHGLTTDMTGATTEGNATLSKLPTVIQIADEVQRQSRSVLEQFIGIKFLPGVVSQIEGRLAMMLKGLVAAQIISAYTGVKASVAQDDPTVAQVEAYYSPVFPLLYICLTFNLRSSL